MPRTVLKQTSISQKIETIFVYVGFFGSEKAVRNSGFYLVSRMLDPDSDRTGLALSTIQRSCRSLGDRYLRPFLFLHGRCSTFVTCRSLSDQKFRTAHADIYIPGIYNMCISPFHPKKQSCRQVKHFSQESLPKMLQKTHTHTHTSFFFIPSINQLGVVYMTPGTWYVSVGYEYLLVRFYLRPTFPGPFLPSLRNFHPGSHIQQSSSTAVYQVGVI